MTKSMETVPDEFWIVVTQWDTTSNVIFDPCNPPKGPLVHEAYCLTEEEAKNRAMALRGYGWAAVVRVNPFVPRWAAQAQQDHAQGEQASPMAHDEKDQ